MNLTDIAKIRLITQQIDGTKFKSAKDIVGWMGAMQAQDYKMAKWAIGLRAPKATEEKIEAAIDNGEIIRTHLLRPTWHFVSADNIYWMLELTAPRLKVFQKSWSKRMGLAEKFFTKSNLTIEKVLRDGKHLTRAELLKELEKNKIVTDSFKSSHILFRAEIEGIICSGITKEKQSTYALLSERVPKNKSLNKDEALFKLAKKYFESHCPATLQDFIWWSGLTVSDAKHALEMAKQNFVPEKIESQTYWFLNSFSIPKKFKESVYLLPAFDEFLVSYKDRTAAVAFENHKHAFSNNGIFWPTIVINGQVRGTWKRTIKKDKTIIETNFFEKPDKNTKALVEKESGKISSFLQNKIEIIYH